ncbi:lipoprotein LenA [Leptospira neocaledonica]|uniref:Lipoprotein LenA n=1 Tax=Leptospira neocaledonica TaxID=2023192 RepID=A0A2N0A179_9LEPT|nr:lipoprotein LenA [Leptospira neocaledonica]PJZ78072.1 lipoprotein LenA [Leptospira neocaledonica]
MKIGKKLSSVILMLAILFLAACKKQEEAPTAQIIGTKYSGWDQWIYKKPGTTEKSEQLTIVYGNEEVTGLEIVNHESTDSKGVKTTAEYIKVRTVDGKEGYAALKNFFDAVLFVIADGAQAFAKNSLTSPSKGKLERGMSCFELEASGDFSKVRCYAAIIKGGKLNNLYDVWIQPDSPSISKDPLLGDSIRNLKTASNKLIEAEKATDPAKQEELKTAAAKALKAVAEKGDAYLEDANTLASEYGLTITE